MPLALRVVMQAERLGLVGSCIADKYFVEAVVVETDVSVVYRAMHSIWKRPVAIKALKSTHTTAEARDAVLASFVREGALLAELSESCSAICQARDIGSLTTADGTWILYTVLEWLDGETLEAVVTRERAAGARRRSIEEVMELMAPIAEALAVAHARDVVHRDVKPSNIMLGTEHTKLLDFGIAKSLHSSVPDASGIIERAYTPAFAAPEQFDPSLGEAGPWTDVFSLALIMVELLCGHEALAGDSIVMLAKNACDADFRPTPRAFGAIVSDQVEAVFRHALEVDPLKRTCDASKFWAALVRATSLPNIPIPLQHPRVPLAPKPLTPPPAPVLPQPKRVPFVLSLVIAGVMLWPSIANALH
jgi:serine/threonine protein kinase